jgi:hypothetical protein
MAPTLKDFIEACGKRVWFRQKEYDMLDDFQISAIFEAYSTLRAGYYAMRETMPEVAAIYARTAADLRFAFPAIERLEQYIRLGEAELGKGAASDGAPKAKPS